MFIFVNIIFLSVYIKVAYIVYKAKREIQDQMVSVDRQNASTQKAQSKTTKSLLLVIGVFMSTYIVWSIIYFATIDTHTDAALLAQSLTDWFWQVGIFLCFVPTKNPPNLRDAHPPSVRGVPRQNTEYFSEAQQSQKITKKSFQQCIWRETADQHWSLQHVFFLQINIWINPFIYAFRNKDFRRAFRCRISLITFSSIVFSCGTKRMNKKNEIFCQNEGFTLVELLNLGWIPLTKCQWNNTIWLSLPLAVTPWDSLARWPICNAFSGVRWSSTTTRDVQHLSNPGPSNGRFLQQSHDCHHCVRFGMNLHWPAHESRGQSVTLPRDAGSKSRMSSIWNAALTNTRKHPTKINFSQSNGFLVFCLLQKITTFTNGKWSIFNFWTLNDGLNQHMNSSESSGLWPIK